MKTLYLDLFSGISGDMFLGALVDLGVDAERLEADLRKLGLGEWHLHVARDSRGGLAGVRVQVHSEEEHSGTPNAILASAAHQHPHHEEHHHHSSGPEARAPAAAGAHGHGRTLADIRRLIEDSALSPWVKGRAVAVFQHVARAEGKIHGRPEDAVHFHEVGALDSIIDTVGGCLALETLGRPRVLASAVIDGTGVVSCAHGTLPLPAPATAEILSARGVVFQQCEEPHELVTPTGAAFLAEFAESFGPMRALRVDRIGYGLGLRQNQTRPNVLRAFLGETRAASEHDWETDTVMVLETNLDDVSSEIVGAVMEKALAAGALDVFHTPIQMKKSRPGVLLSILCHPAEADRFSEMLLRETSAFGVRRFEAERRKLRREVLKVSTPFGEVEVKLGRLDGAIVQAAPEFESCRQVAAARNVPLKQVYDAALRAWQARG